MVLGTAALISVQVPAAQAAAACTDGAMNIVAHTDDDLLFLSPDFMRDLQTNRCTLSVFLTAGEAGEGSSYWNSLENGIEASYAQMAGKANSWAEIDDGIANRDIKRQQLAGSNIQVMFIRIPDGFPDGSGSDTYNNQSILKLWNGTLSSVTPVDGRAAYTKAQLKSVLVTLMNEMRPTTVRTQDWTGTYKNPYDHSDHWASAQFAHVASQAYTSPHTLTAYDAYVIDEYPQNVWGDELTQKVKAFTTFAPYDHNVCNTPGEGCPDSPYDEWLKRQYITAVEWTGDAAKDSGTTVTASSQKAAAQSPEKARDGYAWGDPMDASKEWVSNGEKAGAWIQYTFAQPTAVSEVNLFDRPLATEQITSGVLEFSDGSTVQVGALPNNGSALTVPFPGRTVTSVKFRVTGVSGTTTAAGLAEFEVFKGTDTTPPVVTADPAAGAYPAGTQIKLTANEAATIKYTTDGSDPTVSGQTYSGPITLNAAMTLKYYGTDTAGNSSAVASQAYTLADDKTPPVVTADPAAGAYPAGTQIKLTANEAATIKYTTDGSDPTVSGQTYSGPITLNAAMTLKYYGTDTAGNSSAVASQAYTIAADTTPPVVTADPAAGAYPAGTQIKLTANEAATIKYTTDGSDPTVSGQTYSGPITLNAAMTLKYYGTDTAGNSSAVASQAYTIKPPAVTQSWHDFTGDGLADVLAADGASFKLFAGNGDGTIGAGTQIATGWTGINATITPGDFNGDGKSDVLARASSGGALWLYPGNGSGGLNARVQVGWGWDVMTAILSPGDFNGDGKSDVLARDSGGNLWLYPGDGAGGWKSRSQVGWGWNVMNVIVSGRDFTGDGKNDVLARDTSGNLWVYPGNGSGGWGNRIQMATGWQSMTAIAAPGDLTGDGKADVIARDSSGTMWLYPGDGTGHIGTRTQLATGWGTYKNIS
ncbi:hypothetical protein SCMU_17140 [Sinomonas cyclohexanicum]|uniref:F5/8 type C domain-containing protein n=1 Tax=Sinomonas cyclohexanicum TaxID=322009 RepID=A0ABM7PUX2_SINCY|nr:chitobiase/beta-hexosaminidase C-terminal domain-containing protein [Corynebacterium cyclohexanicum]BCT75872.1 hypothetical protein SCMU_17140 [Corynebacterium cyclohexanicum]